MIGCGKTEKYWGATPWNTALSRFKRACKGMYLESRVDCGDYVIYRFGDSYSWDYDETKFKVNVTSEYHIWKYSRHYQDIDLVLSTLETL